MIRTLTVTFLAGVSGVSGAGDDSLDIKFNVDPGLAFWGIIVPVGVSQQPEKETVEFVFCKYAKAAAASLRSGNQPGKKVEGDILPGDWYSRKS